MTTVSCSAQSCDRPCTFAVSRRVRLNASGAICSDQHCSFGPRGPGEATRTDAHGGLAKFELIARGADAVPEVVSRLATLRFGKLIAIEAFEALEDARACPALIGLLADNNETVVEWPARALGSLGRYSVKRGAEGPERLTAFGGHCCL